VEQEGNGGLPQREKDEQELQARRRDAYGEEGVNLIL